MTILHPDLTPASFALFILCALIIGMSKAGLSGFGLTAVPLMALIFGARQSTGVILPMLIAADIMAVAYWRRHAVWKYILAVLPWTAAGIVAALIIGEAVNDNQFRLLLLSIVWIMLALMVFNDLKKREDKTAIPEGRLFSSFMGFSGGFATMIGNAAGPVFTLYFLSMRLPKKEFIGTSAWLFFIINTGKLPLQVLVWKNISYQALVPGIVSVPVIALGIWAGVSIVKLLPEKVYRYIVIGTTIATSFFPFLTSSCIICSTKLMDDLDSSFSFMLLSLISNFFENAKIIDKYYIVTRNRLNKIRLRRIDCLKVNKITKKS